MGFVFCDLEKGIKGPDIGLLLPGFQEERECVVVISPHDDDALLGAGYLLPASMEAGADVKIVIMCDGRAGYSRVEDKPGIVEQRKKETIAAYGVLGISAESIARLEVPDFSAIHYLGWELPGGEPGVFAKLVPRLREWGATRLIVPNGFREHIDHTAAYLAGVFFGPQTGDAVVAEWGKARPVKSSLIYSVWADFPGAGKKSLRADKAILAPLSIEDRIMEALMKFESQKDVISGLVEHRQGRKRGDESIELYMGIDPRPALEFGPYWDRIQSM